MKDVSEFVPIDYKRLFPVFHIYALRRRGGFNRMFVISKRAYVTSGYIKRSIMFEIKEEKF